MSITINGQRQIDDDKMIIFFTIVDGTDSYKWCANTPLLSGQELQDYLDNNEQNYLNDVMIKINTGVYFDPHPEIMTDKDEPLNRGKISEQTKSELQNATTVAQLRTVLLKIFIGSG